MTNEEKHSYLLRFQRFQKSREKFYAPKINEALHKQYLQFTSQAKEKENGLQALHNIDSSGISKVIKNLYMDAGIVYGARIRSDFNRQGVYKKKKEQKNRRPIGFSERMAQLIADYFRTDILNTSEFITQTTKDLITQVFTDAYALGLGINDIIAQLENTELSRVRARMIARTETVTAANKGALFVANETGLLVNKTWLATKDSRTRHDHSKVDGNQVGKDDYFVVGGYDMLVPGDRGGKNGKPQVDPKEYINCRCAVTFEAMRDKKGNLIQA